MKTIRGDNPVKVIMHIHGNITRKLCVAFITKKRKCRFFLFYSIKPENRREEQVLPGG
jgi:hypothetical protein